MAAAKSKQKPKPKRETGRPRKGEGRAFPEQEVDRLLVYGETDEFGRIHYPSFRELGERYGVAHSGIADYARSHNCLSRRKQVVELVRRRTDEKVAERVAERLAMQTDDLLRIVDSCVKKFEEALQEGRIRLDNVGDLNLLCRLRAFLMGESESRREVVNGLSVDFVVQNIEESRRVVRQIEEKPGLAGFTAVPWLQQGKD